MQINKIIYLAIFFLSFRALSIPSFHLTVSDILFGVSFILISVKTGRICFFNNKLSQTYWIIGGFLISTWILFASLFNNTVIETIIYLIQILYVLVVYPPVINYLIRNSVNVNDIVKKIISYNLIMLLFVFIAYLINKNLVSTFHSRLFGFMNNPNAFSRLLSNIVPFVLYSIFINERRQQLFFSLVLLSLIAINVLTGSFSGLLTSLAGIATYIFLTIRKQNIFKTLLITSLLLAIAINTLDYMPDRIQSFFVSGNIEDAGSYNVRIDALEAGLSIIKDYPLVGIGPRQFTEVTESSSEVHFSYIQLMIDFGLPALFFLIIIFASLFRVVINSMKKENRLIWALGPSIIMVFILSLNSSPSMFAREWWFFLILAVSLSDR